MSTKAMYEQQIANKIIADIEARRRLAAPGPCIASSYTYTLAKQRHEGWSHEAVGRIILERYNDDEGVQSVKVSHLDVLMSKDKKLKGRLLNVQVVLQPPKTTTPEKEHYHGN